MSNSISDPRSSHEERTAADPRAASVVPARIDKVELTTTTVRKYTLTLGSPLHHQAGQWVDVWVPGIKRAGGFTIVSGIDDAAGGPGSPCVLLGIQRNRTNPVTSWFWRPVRHIIGTEIQIRVGGKFVYPPPQVRDISRVVFVAGGLGINPFLSMVETLSNNLSSTKSGYERRNEMPVPHNVVLLYGAKAEGYTLPDACLGADTVPFRKELSSLFQLWADKGWQLTYYLTQKTEEIETAVNTWIETDEASVEWGRMTLADAIKALGPVEEREKTVAYVCGPQNMADSFVEALRNAEGMSEDRVFCEKWW